MYSLLLSLILLSPISTSQVPTDSLQKETLIYLRDYPSLFSNRVQRPDELLISYPSLLLEPAIVFDAEHNTIKYPVNLVIEKERYQIQEVVDQLEQNRIQRLIFVTKVDTFQLWN